MARTRTDPPGLPAPDSVPEPLRHYALLADGERGILGGPGTYVVTPSCRSVRGGHYEEGSLIWRSRWVTASGIVECLEALAFPGHPHRAVILRRVIPR